MWATRLFGTKALTGGVAMASAMMVSGRYGVIGCEEEKGDALSAARKTIEPYWARIESELRSQRHSTPRERAYASQRGVQISVKGGSVGSRSRLSVRFPLRPGSDAVAIITESISSLSAKTKAGWSVESFDSSVAKQLSFRPSQTRGLSLVFFQPLAGYGLQELEFIKEGDSGYLSQQELKVILNALALSSQVSMEYQEAQENQSLPSSAFPPPRRLPPSGASKGNPLQQSPLPRGEPTAEEELAGLGARVYLPPKDDKASEEALEHCKRGNFDRLWGNIAGYERQKRQIEDSLLLNLFFKETFTAVSKGTRVENVSNLPKAVLFDGPPGTGKTSAARALSEMAVIPLVYVPIESITSKYYGESEKILAQLFAKCASLSDKGVIIFLDEVDALVTSRDSEMHDASRRILGVLLKEIDGFDADGSRNNVVIAATNRKSDLDPALLSRFEFRVEFDLPDSACRSQILGKYAKHLSDEEREELAELTRGFSGRDLKLLCVQAERQWASKIVRKEARQSSLPPFEAYREAMGQRGFR